MPARRTLLEWIAAIVSGWIAGDPSASPAAAACAVAGPPIDLAALPVKWVFDGVSGQSWEAFDIFAWLDWHIPEQVLEQARLGRIDTIEPDQARQLDRLRQRQQCIEVHVPRPDWLPSAWLPQSLLADLGIDPTSTTCSVIALVIVRHWTTQPADVRPFLTAHGLDRDGVVLQFEHPATGTIRHMSAAYFLR